MSKLNIDQKTIEALFSDPKTDFLIPDYQRPYAWSEAECRTLWDDIFSFAFPENNSDNFKTTDEYFLGPIVTFKNDEGKQEIIDGQQRLTTLMLLLRAFYARFRQTYNEVKEKHQYNLVDLDYERFEKLKDLIIEKTRGDLEDINDDIVAMSFKELATRESISKDIQISSLSDENAKKDKHIDNLTNDLIKSYSAPFIIKNSIFEQFVINLINYLPMICGIIGTVVIFALDTILTKEVLTKSKLLSFVPLIVSIVFVVIDKYLDNSIISKLRVKFVNCAKTKYIKKVEKQLPPEAEPFKEQIINYCLTSKEIFRKQ